MYELSFVSSKSHPFPAHRFALNILVLYCATTSTLLCKKMENDQEHVMQHPGIILCMRPANESRRYNVTSSLIGWVHAQNDP